MGVKRGTWRPESFNKMASKPSTRSKAMPVSINKEGVSKTDYHMTNRSGHEHNNTQNVSEYRQDELIRATEKFTDTNSPTPVVAYSNSFKKAKKDKEEYMAKYAASVSVSSRSTAGSVIRQAPEVYSPLFQIANLQLPRDRITMNAWNRNFYDTHPLIHNCINLHATYPINKLNIKCKDRKIEQFFNDMIQDMDLINIVQNVALEYWKIGEKIKGSSLITMADGSVKPIKQVKVGDIVITHKGNKKRVLERFVKHTNAVIEKHLKIYKVYVDGLYEPLVISGRHPIFVCKSGKEDFVETFNVKSGDVVYSPFNTDSGDSDLTAEFCYMAGYCISNENIRAIKSTSDLFRKHCIGVGKDRRLSSDIMSSSKHLQIKLLAGLVDSFGKVNRKTGDVAVELISYNLVNQLAMIFRRAGISPLIDKYFEIDGTCIYRICTKSYEVENILGDALKNRRKYNINAKELNIERRELSNNRQPLKISKIEDITDSFDDDYMYDIEVEDDHSYIANGIAIHNCFPYAELDENRGVWKGVVIQNPDYVHVKTSVLTGDAVISLRPDAALQRLVQSNAPADIQLKKNISEEILYHVRKGNNIPLDNFHVSHLKLLSSPYDIHGTSPIVSVYKDAMLYDQLRESKFAQAGNLINPITLVKVGGTTEGEYHPTSEDLENYRQIFESAAHDRDYKIITHAGVTVERVGASGSIIDISPDMAFIVDNILFGLMVPKAVLTQEGASFNSATVGLEVLKQRYESFRNMMAQWLTKKIFAPISEIREFYEYRDGEKKLIVPEIEWNRMILFDMDNYINALTSLAREKQVSQTTLFRSLGLNIEEERRLIKEEMINQTIAAKEAQLLQGMELGALRALDPEEDIIEPTDNIGLPGTPGTEEAGIPGAGLMPGGLGGGGMGPPMGGEMALSPPAPILPETGGETPPAGGAPPAPMI